MKTNLLSFFFKCLNLFYPKDSPASTECTGDFEREGEEYEQQKGGICGESEIQEEEEQSSCEKQFPLGM